MGAASEQSQQSPFSYAASYGGRVSSWTANLRLQRSGTFIRRPLLHVSRTMCLGTVSGLILAAAVQAAPPSFELEAELRQALDNFDEAQRVQNDQPNRARQLFRLAAQRFHSIVASGVVNGGLEYNLGNCYLQAGDVGRAILHYRRAQRLIPRDEHLASNLQEARSQCLTTIHSTRRSLFFRSVFFWHYQTSVFARAEAALTFYVLIWILLITRNFVPRRAVTWSATVCAILASCAATSVAATHWADRNAPEGVVVAMDVMVYKGPGTEYQRQFEEPLQPGVEFTLRERRGDWWRVELADGKSGWIQAHEAELIRPALRKNLRP